jgi:DNA-binding NarL/FixJ family response regulator
MLRIFIVDDHPHSCDGLAEWLPIMDSELEVVGTAYSGWEALEKIETILPEVVLLDCSLPDLDGPDVAKEIKLQGWPVKVLAFSGDHDQGTVNAMLKVGAMGYILKTEKRESILEAIRAVGRGERWYSQPVVALLSRRLEEEEGLTQRELEVLRLLSQGLTGKQIAFKLQIGPRTTETHIAKIYKKLKAQNKGDAVRIAGEKGLLR